MEMNGRTLGESFENKRNLQRHTDFFRCGRSSITWREITTGMIRKSPTMQVYGFEKTTVLLYAQVVRKQVQTDCHVYVRTVIGILAGE